MSFGNAPLFWRQRLERMRRMAHEDKFTILGILSVRALGDFVIAIMACVYAKKKIRNSALLIYAHDDRPYKNDILMLCPHIDDKVMGTGPGMPIAWFDVPCADPNAPPKEFVEAGFPHTNLVLFPALIADLFNPSKIEFIRCLAIPEDLDGEIRQRLLDAGASPDRWIVCLHAREDDYEFRKYREPDRSVDPVSYFQLADYIIDELGGQVVRLGDPSMTPAPARSHLVDLSRGNDFLLQAYAVSRCRFAITTDSGMQLVANGLGVPFATTNVTMLDILFDECGFSPWHDQHLVLTKKVFAKDAVPDDSSEFGRMTDFNECIMFDNGSQEFRDVTNHMMAKTDDCQGWRNNYIERSVEAVDTISFPFPSVPTSPNWFKLPWWEESPELACTLTELRKQAKRDGLIP